MPEIFSRKHRLLAASDYRRVFADPFRASNKYFTVLAIHNGESYSRLGLAIAKKQLKRAVDRNRIKRMVREYFRTQVCQQAEIAADYVVMAKNTVRDVTNAHLHASINDCFKQIQHHISAMPK